MSDCCLHPNFETARRFLRVAHVAAWLLLLLSVGHAEILVLHLKNGDRITATVISESTNALVVSTPWLREVSVAPDQIERRELVPADSLPPSNPPGVLVTSTNPPPPARNLVVETTAKPDKPNAAKLWKVDAKFGLALVRGVTDSQNYYGAFTLTYDRPYQSAPAESFRNRVESQMTYSQVDGVQSANLFFAGDRVDFDISRNEYIYNYVGGGFDQVRKIESQYEIGPGVGSHLLRRTNLVANLDGGFTFQEQNRVGAESIDAVYLRVGQDLAWKLPSNINFTQRAAWLTRVDAPEQMQLRWEANLAFALMQNLSFNFSVLDLYDTRPVPGVTPNGLQLRSSLGFNF
jgi:hypothetical protein